MTLLSRKSVLAVTAVVDVALHGDDGPVSARALAARHKLPPRHLEPVLQALVRAGILKGVRGPLGGYALARARERISADDILQAAGAIEQTDGPEYPPSPLVRKVVQQALREATQSYSDALAQVSVADMARAAKALK
jgi:Rrf2 family iron-sulfur cluster assembly transcriptional regulator